MYLETCSAQENKVVKVLVVFRNQLLVRFKEYGIELFVIKLILCLLLLLLNVT